MSGPSDLTIHELHARLRRHEISPAEILQSVDQRITEWEPKVNGYVTLLTDEAKEQAATLTTMPADASRIWGIPLAIKDNICTRGTLTTCASNILRNFVSPYDAFAVERIRQQQGIIIGKTNLDEFAMGASNETSCFGPVHNPLDGSRVPGGSSGGSAAVVAYGGAIAALGSDTGGSVRQPAAFCGIVGLKPTYGRVSRWGLVAFASSLDQIGCLTKDVRDAAIMLQVIAGRDEHDSTSVAEPVPDYFAQLERDNNGTAQLRIGVPAEYFAAGLDPRIEAIIRRMLEELKPYSAGVVDVSLPHTPAAVPAYYLVCMSEASSNLARYDGVRYGYRADSCATLEEQYQRTRGAGFYDEVKRRILLGTFSLSKGSYEEYYGTGQKVRTLIREDFHRVFRQVDVIITPTTPTTAFRLGEKIDDPLAMYLGDIYTVAPSLAGLPAISIPAAERVDALPVGLQIIGRPFEELTVLKVARSLERVSGKR